MSEQPTEKNDEKKDAITAPPDEKAIAAVAQEKRQVAAAALMEKMPFIPENATDLWKFATSLAAADILPKALIGKPANVMLVMLKGIEMGLTPIQAVSEIGVIAGKVVIGASMQRGLILRSGKCRSWKRLTERDDAEKCTIRHERSDWPEGTFEDVTFTIEEAKKLGLLARRGKDGGENEWEKQPATMLMHRCTTRIARESYPDVVIAYDTNEAPDLIDSSASVSYTAPPTQGATVPNPFQPATREEQESADPELIGTTPEMRKLQDDCLQIIRAAKTQAQLKKVVELCAPYRNSTDGVVQTTMATIKVAYDTASADLKAAGKK